MRSYLTLLKASHLKISGSHGVMVLCDDGGGCCNQDSSYLTLFLKASHLEISGSHGVMVCSLVGTVPVVIMTVELTLVIEIVIAILKSCKSKKSKHLKSYLYTIIHSTAGYDQLIDIAGVMTETLTVWVLIAMMLSAVLESLLLSVLLVVQAMLI